MDKHTKERTYYVVDLADEFVLYHGSLYNCEQVQIQNYAGLAVISFRELTPKMLASVKYQTTTE